MLSNKEEPKKTGVIRARQKKIERERSRSRIVWIAVVAGILLLILAGKSLAGKALKVGREDSGKEKKKEATVTATEDKEDGKDTVESYEWLIEEYAAQEGIDEYVLLLMAIMMVESEGNGDDPMKTAESPFNTRGYMDADYSIQCGVLELKSMLEEAGCTGPDDIDGIALALQGYNYGNDYVSWALENYGGYSLDNAGEFADKMCYELGWSSYGDPYYVSKVLQYYPQ